MQGKLKLTGVQEIYFPAWQTDFPPLSGRTESPFWWIDGTGEAINDVGSPDMARPLDGPSVDLHGHAKL